MKWHLAIAFGLVAGIFGVYFQVVDHEFVNYDDLMYLSRLQFELDSESIRRAFTEPFQVNWIPLTWISMLIDHSLYGDDPTGYLLTNVALHAVAAVLLYAAFARMTKAIWPSAFVAAVFAIHPLHVESVAWMSARKDVLSGVSFAFTLLTYARYAERPTPLRYALVAIGVLFALMSKPSVVTLPFVLLLLDYWPLGRLRADPARRLPDAMLLRRAVLEKLPLFVAVAAVATATLLAQRSAEIGVSDDLFSLGTRIANGFVSYAAYVRQGFWPSGLAAFYPHPGETISSAHAAGAALLLAVVTAFAMRLANTRPYLAAGWFWFLGMLIPMIGFVQVGIQARADRYMYLPLIGLTLAVAFAAAQGLAHRRVGRAVFAVAAGVVVLALGAVGFVQVGYWRDTTALFERAIAVTENNAFAHSSLGAAYQDSKRFEDAELQLEKAVSLRPDWAVPRIRLADLLAEQQRWEEAVPHYQRGIEDQPGNAHLRINLGQILIRLQRYGEARVELERGEKQWDQLDPVERYSLHQGLARADWEEGYFGSAIRHYQSAVQLRPNHPGREHQSRRPPRPHRSNGCGRDTSHGRGFPRRSRFHRSSRRARGPGLGRSSARGGASIPSGVAPESGPDIRPGPSRMDSRHVPGHRAARSGDGDSAGRNRASGGGHSPGPARHAGRRLCRGRSVPRSGGRRGKGRGRTGCREIRGRDSRSPRPVRGGDRLRRAESSRRSATGRSRLLGRCAFAKIPERPRREASKLC